MTVPYRVPSSDIARLGYQTSSGAEGNKQIPPGGSTILTRELKAQERLPGRLG